MKLRFLLCMIICSLLFTISHTNVANNENNSEQIQQGINKSYNHNKTRLTIAKSILQDGVKLALLYGVHFPEEVRTILEKANLCAISNNDSSDDCKECEKLLKAYIASKNSQKLS